MARLHATYIGGPTALLEIDGLRLLTDPTLDPGGTAYPTAAYTLQKAQSPAVPTADFGRVDAVLLSHDHHFDNLDTAGRALLAQVGMVYTTDAGTDRRGRGTAGLHPWDEVPLSASLRLVATPTRHGPEGGDCGPVTGFILAAGDGPVTYVSGDTVWYEEVRAVGERHPIELAFLNLGAARVAVAGPAPLTFTAREASGRGHRFAPALPSPDGVLTRS